jgi:hypothetical protein
MVDIIRVCLLAGGVSILALIGLFFWLVHRMENRIAARADELLRQGASPEQAVELLAAEGDDREAAAKGVRRAVEESILDAAADVIANGGTEAEAAELLTSHGASPTAAADHARDLAYPPWSRRYPVLCIVLGVPLFLLGLATVIASLVIRDGNLTGRFVTFPFAGALTKMVGTFILLLGGTLAALPFFRPRSCVFPSEPQAN